MKPFPIDFEQASPNCSLDPITLVGIALAGVAGAVGTSAASGLFGGSGGQQTQAQQSPIDAPAVAKASEAPSLQPTTQKIKGKQGNQPSFIGAAATPDNKSFGAKTL